MRIAPNGAVIAPSGLSAVTVHNGGWVPGLGIMSAPPDSHGIPPFYEWTLPEIPAHTPHGALLHEDKNGQATQAT